MPTALYLFFLVMAVFVGMSIGGMLRDSVWMAKADDSPRMLCRGKFFRVTHED